MRGRSQRFFSRLSKKTWLLIAAAFVGLCVAGGGAYAALGGVVRQSVSGDVDLSRGLIGHWKLDGNAKDSTPYGNDGTVTGATLIADRKAKANSAYSFNVGTARINFGANATLRPSSGLAVGVWANPSNITADTTQLIVDMAQTGGYALVINNSASSTCPSQLTFQVYVSGAYHRACTAKTVLTNNTWSHIAGTYDGANVVLYVNGVSVATTAIAGSISYSSLTTPLCLGNSANASSCATANPFAGSADDLHVYNRALGAASVMALYESYDVQINAASGLNGLVGHWKLDGNGKDSSPYANNATVTGANYVPDRKGRTSSAFQFVSSSNEVEIPYSSAFNPTVAMTAGAWIKLGSYGTGVQRIVANLDTGGYGLYITGSSASDVCGTSNLCFRVRINGAYQHISTPLSGLTGDVWHYVAGTYDGTYLRLYVNNTLAATSANLAGSISTNTAALCIGSAPAGASCTSNYLNNVDVDDVRIYSRALSLAEVTALYSSYDSQINLNSSPGSNTTAGNINQGLVAYWPLNGNAKDATPYSNNGIISGATLVADRKGRANSAYSIGGNPNHIRVPYSSVLMPTAAVSLSAWFRANTAVLTGSQAQRIAGNIDSGDGYGLIVNGPTSTDACGTSVLCFRAKVNGTVIPVTTPISGLVDGTWYLVTGTFDGTNLRLYLNGSLVNTSSSVGTMSVSTSSVCIGARPNGNVSCNANYLSGNGAVDEVRIYNRALSTGEVQMLYTSNN